MLVARSAVPCARGVSRWWSARPAAVRRVAFNHDLDLLADDRLPSRIMLTLSPNSFLLILLVQHRADQRGRRGEQPGRRSSRPPPTVTQRAGSRWTGGQA